MTGPAAWPHLRRAKRAPEPRPQREHGRHRRSPVTTETPLPPVSPAASLPQHDYRASTPPPLPAEPQPEPDKIVECGFCHVSGLSSQMTQIGGGQFRCDLRRPDCECVQRNIRWRETGARPAPILSSPLEPLPEPEPPVLPAAQEAALAAFNEASDEQDAAEGKDLSEDEEPAEAAAGAGITPGPLVPDQGANETAEAAPVAAETETPDGGDRE